MPYIIPISRDGLDPTIDELSALIRTSGELNYTVTRLILNHLGYPDQPLSYPKINDVFGVIECVKHEIYRRVAAPYEDKKKQENGDVF